MFEPRDDPHTLASRIDILEAGLVAIQRRLDEDNAPGWEYDWEKATLDVLREMRGEDRSGDLQHKPKETR